MNPNPDLLSLVKQSSGIKQKIDERIGALRRMGISSEGR
jgi:hypothetical protein